MVRNKYSVSNAGKSPSKKSRTNSKQHDAGSDQEGGEGSSGATLIDGGSASNGVAQRCDSVHKQNLYIISFPVIFVFNVLRSLLYQLFIIFRYIYNFTTRVVYKPVRKECGLEIVINDQQQPKAQIQPNLDQQQQLSYDQQQALPLQYSSSGVLINGEGREMSVQRSASGSQVGPGDPLLAKQKHHHRRAFEYISKALKIDEENEGEYSIVISYYYD